MSSDVASLGLKSRYSSVRLVISQERTGARESIGLNAVPSMTALGRFSER
jgi:hypothetical protein